MRKTYKNICRDCTELCKQSPDVQVVYCAHYTPRKLPEKDESTTKRKKRSRA